MLIDYLISRYPGRSLVNAEIEDDAKRLQRTAELNSYLHAALDNLQHTWLYFILEDKEKEYEISVDAQIEAAHGLPGISTISLRNCMILEAKASRLLHGLQTERLAVENGLRLRRSATFEVFDKWRKRDNN